MQTAPRLSDHRQWMPWRLLDSISYKTDKRSGCCIDFQASGSTASLITRAVYRPQYSASVRNVELCTESICLQSSGLFDFLKKCLSGLVLNQERPDWFASRQSHLIVDSGYSPRLILSSRELAAWLQRLLTWLHCSMAGQCGSKNQPYLWCDHGWGNWTGLCNQDLGGWIAFLQCSYPAKECI